MFCQSCGISNNQNAKFCGNCGTILNINSITIRSTSNAKEATNVEQTSPKQPLSFRDFMENRQKVQNQDAALTSIQERKTNERTSEISKKKTKKDEIVKVFAYL